MKYFLLLFFFPTCLFAQNQQLSIVPAPVSLVQRDGAFVINDQTNIDISLQSKSLQSAAIFFRNAIKDISGLNLPIHSNNPVNQTTKQKIALLLIKDSAIGAEGYHLFVSSKGIQIKANTPAGIIYGIQTLLQTLPAVQTNATLSVPCMEVTDFPRFKWRGMHLDVSRHFFGPNLIKQYLDCLLYTSRCV